MTTPPDVLFHLSCAGISLVVDARHGRLPSILHWGEQLGDLDEDALLGLSEASVPVIGSNNADVPPRVALLPEHHTGWTGRPGLTGSSRRTAVVARVHDDGDHSWTASPSSATSPRAPARVEFRAVDEAAALRLTWSSSCCRRGLVRVRAPP